MAAERTTNETLLGQLGPVEFMIAQTQEPGAVDVDAFLVSVGSELGGVGRALKERYPRAPWPADLRSLRPDTPHFIELNADNRRPRWAILATVHPDPSLQPTESEVLVSIPEAVTAAISVAHRLPARSLLVPLLGAGRLRMPKAPVARTIIACLQNLARSQLLQNDPRPSRIVLLAQTSSDEQLIREAWAEVVGPNPSASPAPDAALAVAAGVAAGTGTAHGGSSSARTEPSRQGSNLAWLQPSALASLAYADALRRALGLYEVHMEHLVLGLDQDPSVHRRLEESGLRRENLLEVIASVAGLRSVPPVTPGTLDELPPLSANASEAVRLARSLSGPDGDAVVDTAQLLRGTLFVDSSLIEAILQRAPHLARVRDGDVEAELMGGVSADLVDPEQGIPLDKDDLGVRTYVTMMASAIARKDTKLPLSIGLFGEWGSGKSYFMGLLRGEVEKLADEGGDAYHRGIVQIGFNAWSYADTNLWASLGDEIFRSLAGPPEDEEKENEERRRRRQGLQEWLAGQEGRLKELEAAKTAASGEVAKLKAELERQRNDRRGSARRLLRATLEVAQANPDVRDDLDQAWSKLGITDEAERAVLLADAVTGTRDDLTAIRRSASAGPRYLVIAGAVLGLLLLIAALTASGLAARWLAGSGVVTLLAAAGTLAVAMRRVSDGVRVVTKLADDIRRKEEVVGKDEKVTEALSAVRNAEAREQVLQAQLDEVVARIGELGRELIELSPGQRLYAFLAERAASDDYRGRLGLIATIRRDFERLARLQEDWRKDPTDNSPSPIDRIVLYIDDLDRCTPQQVVEVLQAVHLLLALDLFVVVVGVDPRWLLHSLRDQYRSLLIAPRTGGRNTDDAAANGTDAGVRAEEGLTESEADRLLLSTPQDYLEKIFNVPFVLPRMTPAGFDTMIRRLSEPEPEHEPEVTPRAPAPSPAPSEPAEPLGHHGRVPVPRPEPDIPGAEDLMEEGSEAASIQHGVKVVRTPLTERELAMLSSLAPLVRSPREAKRLLNLYRMLRSTKNLGDASSFLDHGDEPGRSEAVAVLLGFLTANPRLLGQILFTAPDPDSGIAGGICTRDSSVRWAELLEGLRPRLEGDRWRNDVSACLADAERAEWDVLLYRAKAATDAVRLRDMTAFKEWAPHVARFSFLLAPSSRDVGQR